MILRAAKTSLVLAMAFYFTLVVLNNITDYNSNYRFIHHVLLMDSTFPNNTAMWRAVHSPAIHTMFYIVIIVWESIAMFLCWLGGVRLARNLKTSSATFQQAKSIKTIQTVCITLGYKIF